MAAEKEGSRMKAAMFRSSSTPGGAASPIPGSSRAYRRTRSQDPARKALGAQETVGQKERRVEEGMRKGKAPGSSRALQGRTSLDSGLGSRGSRGAVEAEDRPTLLQRIRALELPPSVHERSTEEAATNRASSPPLECLIGDSAFVAASQFQRQGSWSNLSGAPPPAAAAGPWGGLQWGEFPGEVFPSDSIWDRSMPNALRSTKRSSSLRERVVQGKSTWQKATWQKARDLWPLAGMGQRFDSPSSASPQRRDSTPSSSKKDQGTRVSLMKQQTEPRRKGRGKPGNLSLIAKSDGSLGGTAGQRRPKSRFHVFADIRPGGGPTPIAKSDGALGMSLLSGRRTKSTKKTTQLDEGFNFSLVQLGMDATSAPKPMQKPKSRPSAEEEPACGYSDKKALFCPSSKVFMESVAMASWS